MTGGLVFVWLFLHRRPAAFCNIQAHKYAV
ncbi:hypothetical protein M703_01875 [Neisseria gonorrhoeae SK29344]|nr:hypothetical protein M703_01875 [Neisseria gonorrhoeae SK29344]KLS26557.1 hypothetical protein M733_02320 [Neisseria gonorrhoeae ATL_2011_05-13]KLS36699.1 hypothetical protein M724_06255 [Neisseria gonorrhoeae ATL_2011_01_05]